MSETLRQTIYTAGYYGRTLDELVKLSQELDAFVIDVRLVPRSRQPSWNLGVLGKALAGRYAWLKELGNVNYKGGPIAILNLTLGMVKAQFHAGKGNILLLCGCADVEVCHRKVVAEALARQIAGSVIVHLPSPPPPRPKGARPGLFE